MFYRHETKAGINECAPEGLELSLELFVKFILVSLSSIQQGINLDSADLSKLDLRFINFKMANLRKTDLANANLSNCCLERANLSGAHMDVSTFKNIEKYTYKEV